MHVVLGLGKGNVLQKTLKADQRSFPYLAATMTQQHLECVLRG
jgi:hypothetical protein